MNMLSEPGPLPKQPEVLALPCLQAHCCRAWARGSSTHNTSEHTLGPLLGNSATQANQQGLRFKELPHRAASPFVINSSTKENLFRSRRKFLGSKERS